MGPLARVDDDDALRMVDYPGVRGEPFGPVSISEDREPSSQPASAPFDLRSLDPDGTGLDGM